MRIAIVGLGPWGLCALERIVTLMRERHGQTGEVEVHVIEPATPGAGIYDTTQPDFLQMNNSCSDISMYPFQVARQQPAYAPGLYDWAVAHGYRWMGNDCTTDFRGRAIEPEDFLPRSLMGEYLQWIYHALVCEVPAKVKVLHHATYALNVVRRQDGREEVHLADGHSIIADHVILTFGHVGNTPRGDQACSVPLVAPYPVTQHLDPIPPGAKVSVLGMGLVGVDVVAAFTLGRGGRFIDDGDRITYRASGLEPRLELMSPSGMPYKSKAASNTEFPERKRPIVFNQHAIDELRGRGPARIDFRRDVLPLLFGEMSARYYVQLAFNAGGASESLRVSEQLRAAWAADCFADSIESLSKRFGHFDAESMFFARGSHYGSSVDYEDFVCRSILDDINEQKSAGSASPLAAAAEVFRIFRDSIRSVVENGRLSLESHRDFHGDIRTRISRLVAGPPARRLRQIVALVEAGVLRLPYGPAPKMQASMDSTGVRVNSTLLDRPFTNHVDKVVRGYLESPRIEASASPLLSNLYREGRLTALRYGDVSVGSVDITVDSHPVDREGRPQQCLWLFGAVTEGVRYFTHYIPSPHRGTRAFEEIEACVAAILS